MPRRIYGGSTFRIAIAIDILKIGVTCPGILLSLLIIAVTPCAAEPLVTNVSDLQFASIAVIEASDNKNIDALWEHMKPGTRALKVEISTQTDLMEIAERGNLNVYAQIEMCPLGSGMELRGWGEVYLDEFTVSGVSPKKDERARYQAIVHARHPSPPYTYHVYVDWSSGEWKSGRPDKPRYKSYDLATNPEDVCIRVLGGAMGGVSGLATNTVVIPKEAIRTALRAKRT